MGLSSPPDLSSLSVIAVRNTVPQALRTGFSITPPGQDSVFEMRSVSLYSNLASWSCRGEDPPTDAGRVGAHTGFNTGWGILERPQNPLESVSPASFAASRRNSSPANAIASHASSMSPDARAAAQLCCLSLNVGQHGWVSTPGTPGHVERYTVTRSLLASENRAGCDVPLASKHSSAHLQVVLFLFWLLCLAHYAWLAEYLCRGCGVYGVSPHLDDHFY